MVFLRQQKKSVAIMALFQVFFVLVLGTTLVQADGEEPFVGVIKKIARDRIIAKVTERCDSVRSVGEEIMLLITKDTTIRNSSMKVIPLKRLSVGSSVWIKPNTLSNNDVEASILIVEKRRAR